MSEEAAAAFLDRLEVDEDFARELESLKEDPDAVVERVHAAGFDATPDEIREAFLERYGAELTPEQMELIAGGVTAEAITAYVLVGLMAAGAAAGL